MAESNRVPSSFSKEKKAKIFYEHGKDALELAISVADMQEQKVLWKAEKHHRLKAGKSRAGQKNEGRASDRRKRLEAAKIMIAKRQAEAKKEKARSRKEAKSQSRQHGDSRNTAPEDSASVAPRKRVSFA